MGILQLSFRYWKPYLHCPQPQTEDIDFDSSMITLSHTKNRTAQIIPLSQTLANIMREYLKYRKGKAEDYVFCNTYGNKGDIRTYQDMSAAYNRSKGVEKTSARLYRNTFAKKDIERRGYIPASKDTGAQRFICGKRICTDVRQ